MVSPRLAGHGRPVAEADTTMCRDLVRLEARPAAPHPQLAADHADQAVDHVVVTGDRMGGCILDLIKVTSDLTFF